MPAKGTELVVVVYRPVEEGHCIAMPPPVQGKLEDVTGSFLDPSHPTVRNSSMTITPGRTIRGNAPRPKKPGPSAV